MISKKSFIPFIMAGHPTIEDTLQSMLILAESGADIIELGVPFSDPVADGPINQRAAEIALCQGVTLEIILNMVAEVRLRGCQIPIILFSYLNPILSFGYERFAIKAKAVGVTEVLVVDLPPEEGLMFYEHCKQTGLEIILLASPTTDPKRFPLYVQLEPSFLYYISRLAVTGTQNTLAPDLGIALKNLRMYLPGMKIAVGFGISNVEQAAQVANLADGVIIGSLLVKTLEEQGIEALGRLVAQLSKAIHKIDTSQ
jgi:tryptophan synthase alpha chain